MFWYIFGDTFGYIFGDIFGDIFIDIFRDIFKDIFEDIFRGPGSGLWGPKKRLDPGPQARPRAFLGPVARAPKYILKYIPTPKRSLDICLNVHQQIAKVN